MHTSVPSRSTSRFPARHSNGGAPDRGEGDLWGGGGAAGREVPLFRKAHNNNVQSRGGNSERAGLLAMRHFAADVNRGSAGSSPPNPAYNAARPKTTGSVNQSVVGGRRQSMGSMRSEHNSSSSRPPSGQQQQHQRQQSQQQQQRPRLTRNLTLGDLRWTATAAAAAIGGPPGAGGGDNGGNSGVMARRVWQGTTRGGGSSSGVGGGNRQLLPGDSSGGRSRQGSAELPAGEGLSRLPLLESSSPSEKLQQQEEQRQLQLPGSMSISVENLDLSEHGISFGLSALKGRRPYMEDESKVHH